MLASSLSFRVSSATRGRDDSGAVMSRQHRIGARASTTFRRRTTQCAGKFFKSKTQRDMEKWHKTREGRQVLEAAEREPRGAGTARTLERAKQAVEQAAPAPNTLVRAAEPHEIDQTTRWVIACFLNRCIHIPMLNAATEQIICVKAVDMVADAIERELHRTGAGHFFADAAMHESKGELDEWLIQTARNLNKRIDVPLMTDKQEFDCIHNVLSLVTHQYLSAKKNDAANHPIKHNWILLINSL